jgi:hypothetical protein
MMKTLLAATVLIAAGLTSAATIADDTRNDRVTIAVFGDWPYSQFLLDNASRLIDSVNDDPEVSLVIHVGDIHSGSMPCTSAGILPPIPSSNPGWNQKIYYQFQQSGMPVVYTPGDNEWTDCHKTKESKSGAPLNELASVRDLFFARLGHTLGSQDTEVLSQAQYFDPAHPEDADYVENVMWEDAKVIFVTLNMPGSNNDKLAWTNGFEKQPDHDNEVKNRTAADIRWLQGAIAEADHRNAKAVVVALQADMWDPAALAVGGDGLNGYTTFVQELAKRAVQFGKPVLLLNGDSHLYEVDFPLADPNSTTGQIHHAAAAPNLMRVTVQGSTNAPAEWLRLTIDPRSNSNPFVLKNVPYCQNPLGLTC